MRFSVDWLTDAPNQCPEERATAGALKLFLGEHSAFAFYDPATGRVSEALNIAAVHLADGIVREWWRILGGRDRRYSLLRHRNGYVLPDVGFRFDGNGFEVSSRQPEYGDEGLRFFFVAPEFVSRSELESILADFVSTVAGRLVEAGVENSALSSAWQRVAASRADPEEAAFCEAAGALDLDPYRIAESDALFIERSGELFCGEALIEFLAGVGQRAESSVQGVARSTHHEVVTGLLDLVQRGGNRAALPVLREVGQELGDSVRRRPGEKAFGPGYRAAHRLRDILGTGNCDQAQSLASLAGRLGNQRFEPVDGDLGVAALVTRASDAVRIHLRPRGGPDWVAWAQNFAFARAVGDALCFPDSGNSVVNGLHGAERQATNRAFGAQFLAPVDEVLAMVEDGRDSTDVSRAFGVNSAVIDHQIENRDRIWQACARAA